MYRINFFHTHFLLNNFLTVSFLNLQSFCKCLNFFIIKALFFFIWTNSHFLCDFLLQILHLWDEYSSLNFFIKADSTSSSWTSFSSSTMFSTSYWHFTLILLTMVRLSFKVFGSNIKLRLKSIFNWFFKNTISSFAQMILMKHNNS